MKDSVTVTAGLLNSTLGLHVIGLKSEHNHTEKPSEFWATWMLLNYDGM
jgi:hypothetical protein